MTLPGWHAFENKIIRTIAEIIDLFDWDEYIIAVTSKGKERVSLFREVINASVSKNYCTVLPGFSRPLTK